MRTCPDSSAGRRRGGRAAAAGADQRDRLAAAGLAERAGHEREHAVGEGDDRVVAFTHPDVERADLGRFDGVAVGVGDRQPVSAKRDGEDGVGGGVDDPQPDPLTRLGGQTSGSVGGLPLIRNNG
jgi:hypothetical protein